MGHIADLSAWPLSGPHTDKHTVIWGKANTAWGFNDTRNDYLILVVVIVLQYL